MFFFEGEDGGVGRADSGLGEERQEHIAQCQSALSPAVILEQDVQTAELKPLS